MKNLFSLLVCLGLVSSLTAQERLPSRLTKKDREALMQMFVQYLDHVEKNGPADSGAMNKLLMSDFPVFRIERLLLELNQQADTINNTINQVLNNSSIQGNVNNITPDSPLDDAFRIFVRQLLVQIEANILQINAAIQDQSAVLGSLNDISVNPHEINSVQDIDNANLSLVTLFKTILRVLLENQFIS